MTVREFCLRHTQVGELCVIRDSGYILAVAFIDYEDLFTIHPNISGKKIKSTEWGYLNITNEDGSKKEIPCHYIDC